MIDESPRAKIPEVPKDSTVRFTRDADLQVAKRIDWRFLLSDPTLRHVAYIGQKDKKLLDALTRFSQVFYVFDSNARKAGLQKGEYFVDLLVAVNVDYLQLQKVFNFVKPGGCLYWEITRKFTFKKANNSVKANDPDWKGLPLLSRLRFYLPFFNSATRVDLLAELGLVDIKMYWHYPNFQKCTEIIPLDDEEALRYFFNRRGSSIMNKITNSLGNFLIKRRTLLYFFLPCVSIVGRKPEV